MTFDYSKSGLPENKKWENALNICHGWLTQNMTMFGPERIESFMQNQPIAAAKLIMANCPDHSEECITLALLGPAKNLMVRNEDAFALGAFIFDERTAALAVCIADKESRESIKPDAAMERDMTRLFMVEALSGMNDQLIGRAKIDKHHQVRWNMLNHFEKTFAEIKGQNPGLDKIFEEALVKSRASLEALDNAAKSIPKAPKPPGMG